MRYNLAIGGFLVVIGLMAMATGVRLYFMQRERPKLMGGLSTDGTGDFYVKRGNVLFPATLAGKARDGLLIFITDAPNPSGITFGTEIVFRKNGRLIEGGLDEAQKLP